MNFLVVGTLRNCELEVYKTMKCLDKALAFSDRLEYFFVESDSTDKTAICLEDLKKSRKDFEYISLGNLSVKMKKRTERLAFCRNKYIEYLWLEKNNWVDYLIVVDMDGVCSELNSKDVKSCWNKKSWSVCTCNQSDYYYDIFALRHPSWSPNNIVVSQEKNRKLGFKEFHLIIDLYSKMLHIPSESEFIKVDSAFGGLAIYNKNKLPVTARYDGLDDDKQEVCEHVKLHEFVTDSGGEIYINPSLIIGKAPNPYQSGIGYAKLAEGLFIRSRKIIYFLNKNKLTRLLKILLRRLFKCI